MILFINYIQNMIIHYIENKMRWRNDIFGHRRNNNGREKGLFFRMENMIE